LRFAGRVPAFVQAWPWLGAADRLDGMLRTAGIYGAALAIAAFGLQWLEYRVWARSHAGPIYVALIAAAFLALGIWVGRRLFHREPRTGPFSPNERAQSSLRITGREREILELLADGRSNKEIAARLGVSPNTVKTHVASLYEKLKVARRTQAIRLARDLRLVP
jgi:DNA-binding CsgD family transcriptional regulator